VLESWGTGRGQEFISPLLLYSITPITDASISVLDICVDDADFRRSRRH
jgi:hypothetical protein